MVAVVATCLKKELQRFILLQGQHDTKIKLRNGACKQILTKWRWHIGVHDRSLASLTVVMIYIIYVQVVVFWHASQTASIFEPRVGMLNNW